MPIINGECTNCGNKKIAVKYRRKKKPIFKCPNRHCGMYRHRTVLLPVGLPF